MKTQRRKTISIIIISFAVFCVGTLIEKTISNVAAEAKTPAELEKEKALKNPFANDLGPDSLDVSKYPADIQKGYQLLKVKCAKCHTASRPLNSQFADAPTWERYVKRMMAKPGCDIPSAEGKQIYQFLAHDSKARKLDASGKPKPEWKAYRKKLLEEFKAKYPARYQELYGAKPE